MHATLVQQHDVAICLPKKVPLAGIHYAKGGIVLASVRRARVVIHALVHSAHSKPVFPEVNEEPDRAPHLLFEESLLLAPTGSESACAKPVYTMHCRSILVKSGPRSARHSPAL